MPHQRCSNDSLSANSVADFMPIYCCWLPLLLQSHCSAERRITILKKTMLIRTEYLYQEYARDKCIEMGGDLATVDSTAERKALVSALDAQTFQFGVWIGLQTKSRSPSKNKAAYAWLTTGRTPKVNAWLPGQPDLAGGCVWQSINPEGWTAKECSSPDTERPFVCQLGGFCSYTCCCSCLEGSRLWLG